MSLARLHPIPLQSLKISHLRLYYVHGCEELLNPLELVATVVRLAAHCHGHWIVVDKVLELCEAPHLVLLARSRSGKFELKFRGSLGAGSSSPTNLLQIQSAICNKSEIQATHVLRDPAGSYLQCDMKSSANVAPALPPQHGS